MEQITVKSIEAAVQKIDSMDENAIERYSETLVIAQQTFVGYILSASIEFENEELVNHLMYYFNVFHESFNQQGMAIAPITDEMIGQYEVEYFGVLDEYQASEDFDLITAFTNQPNLLEFFMSEINYDLEEGNIDDEMLDQLFLVGVAVIAMMSKASYKQ
jgi:hypothetical protein